jgi:rhamnulokinase
MNVRREWDSRGEVYSFRDLDQMAEQSTPFLAFIDPDDDLFYNAPEICLKRYSSSVSSTGQTVPEGQGRNSTVYF